MLENFSQLPGRQRHPLPTVLAWLLGLLLVCDRRLLRLLVQPDQIVELKVKLVVNGSSLRHDVLQLGRQSSLGSGVSFYEYFGMFGYADIERSLVKEGYYRSLCPSLAVA